jgi:hypothetical protein
VIAAEIRASFPFCPHVITADRDYAEVKLSYLTGSFYSYFKNFLFGNSSESPIVWAPKFDCDDFARLFCALLMLGHFQSQGSAAEGVAVGEIHFIQRTGSGHAIVCAFTEQGRKFIEPQTGAILQLTDEEIASIFFVRF